ncbi:MAG: zinc ribbon domain-containing protein [Theionarchaea archaeon]|nr:zinc ribbon domain-containing protein [Theionarchaea archaeon]
MKWKKEVKCIKCGAEVYPEFPFCTKCGHDIPLKERKSPYSTIFTIMAFILGVFTSLGSRLLILFVVVLYSYVFLTIIWENPVFRRLSECDAPKIKRKW